MAADRPCPMDRDGAFPDENLGVPFDQAREILRPRGNAESITIIRSGLLWTFDWVVEAGDLFQVYLASRIGPRESDPLLCLNHPTYPGPRRSNPGTSEHMLWLIAALRKETRYINVGSSWS